MTTIKNCYNIEDLRQIAQRRLPKAIFDYIDGYAEDGVTFYNNQKCMNNYDLVPKVLVDVANTCTATRLFNDDVDSPIILAPTALSRLFHHRGEHAVAKAAAEANLVYTLSTLSSVSIEDVREAGGPRWFQVYCYKDRKLSRDMIRRAKQAGYTAMCLTVDAHVGGNRESDFRNGLTIPPKPNLKTILSSAKHPPWLWGMATSEPVTLANLASSQTGIKETFSLLKYTSEQLDLSLTWDDIAWIKEEWNGPFIIKGILNVEDAKRAIAVGADGIVISNHGGRQLDHTPATLDLLPEFVASVGHQCKIFVDSGFRRGTDVIKALALGASACMVGRAYLFGLSAAGEAGVTKAINLLQSELHRDLKLLGCRSVNELNSEYIRRRSIY